MVAAAVLLLLGACAPPSHAAIEMTERTRFAPSSLTVSRGALVTWRNNGTSIHTVTSDRALAHNDAHAVQPDGAEPWDSGELGVAERFTQRFDVPGEYVYFCRVHEDADMIGVIEVRS